MTNKGKENPHLYCAVSVLQFTMSGRSLCRGVRCSKRGPDVAQNQEGGLTENDEEEKVASYVYALIFWFTERRNVIPFN